MDNRPIGIFDSGVGGLTVASQVIKLLPDEEIVYFGDTARVPYGSKSIETVTKYSRQIIRFLLTKNVKAIVIACNTVSASCIDVLRKEYDIPLISVVEPEVAKECALSTKTKKVGVIGTERTIKSNIYEKLIKEQDPTVKVFSRACPLFVPLAEECWNNNEVAALTAKIYLRDMLESGIDTLLLGCTHYPLLRECISETAVDVSLIDPGVIAASMLKSFLSSNGILKSTSPSNPASLFYVSDDTEKFELICNMVIEKKYMAEKVDIESV